MTWWLAVDEDQVVQGAVGFEVLARDGDTSRYEIDSLVLRSSWQRQGIGRALLAAVLADAAMQDATVSVSIGRDDSPAHALYSYFGFHEIGACETLQDPGVAHLEWHQRRAVRVVCLDDDTKVLLLRWQDPSDGHLVLEPPGGGTEPGESDAAAAVRELVEETGFVTRAADLGRPLVVPRDQWWNGERRIAAESFFLLHLCGRAPEIDQLGLLDDERPSARGHCWLSLDELTELGGMLQPPELVEVVHTMTAQREASADCSNGISHAVSHSVSARAHRDSTRTPSRPVTPPPAAPPAA